MGGAKRKRGRKPKSSPEALDLPSTTVAAAPAIEEAFSVINVDLIEPSASASAAENRRPNKRPKSAHKSEPSSPVGSPSRRVVPRPVENGDLALISSDSIGTAADAKVVLAMDAVVKVFCVHTEPNFSLPWQRKRQYSSSSSGFVIEGKRILTNAHSVEHYTQVKVKQRGSDTKYLAKILAIGTECDIGKSSLLPRSTCSV